jgi:putative ABC transport system permease protein
MNSLALRMAWREGRASAGKFLFVILAVAAGVGALTGVRGFSRAFRAALLSEARTLMAADVSVRTFFPFSSEQQRVFDDLAERGAEVTYITETVSMMGAEQARYPVMVAIKAVDPRAYPFYGQVKLEPPGKLSETLSDQAVAASEDLMLRLGVQTGDTVKIGEAEFRMAALVRLEPDRMTGSLNVGPRMMMTREALERTGLMKFGSRASYRALLRLGPGAPPVDTVRRELEQAFRRNARIADFRQTHPTITRGLDRSTTFLSLISLIALVVGGLGVGTAIHTHLQQKLDSIAILKCVGARSGQVMRIYLAQALGLGLAGSLLGIALGAAVQAAFPRLISAYFTLPVKIEWASRASLEALGVGVLTVLLFSLPPLLGVRRIRPADLFRREMPESRPAWPERLKRAWPSAACSVVLLAGLGGIATWLAGSPRVGWLFLRGVVVSLAALGAVAWLLLRLLRVAPRALPWRMPAAVRHGIANLYRPGSHSAAVLVALGLGVTFILTVYLLQRSLLTEIVRSAPPDRPNVFFLNITERELDGVSTIVRGHPGVQDFPDPAPLVSGRLRSVNGVPIEQLALQGWGRRFQESRSASWSAQRPKGVEIGEGAWWQGRPASPEVSVEDDAAEALGLRVGGVLEWQAGARLVKAKVAAIHRAEVDFIFSPGVLEGLPAAYIARARVRARDVPALQKAIFDQHPTVTVINAAEVLEIVQQVIDQIALVVRFISGFTILGGVIILAAGVAGTRFRRLREVTILKTLGATRGRVAQIFSVEFLILGAVAGLMGSLLAYGLANVLAQRLLEARMEVHWAASLAAVAATALLANFAGWMVSFPLLGRKPLEILRQE